MINFTTNPDNAGLSSSDNAHIHPSEISDFEFAGLLVFNQLLNISQIECIETYFNGKYGLNLITNPTIGIKYK